MTLNDVLTQPSPATEHWDIPSLLIDIESLTTHIPAN